MTGILNLPKKQSCMVCEEEKEDLKRCSVCKMVYYCDEVCQKVGWKSHKLSCQKLTNMVAKADESIGALGRDVVLLETQKTLNSYFDMLKWMNQSIAEKEHVFIVCDINSEMAKCILTEEHNASEKNNPMYLRGENWFIVSIDSLETIGDKFYLESTLRQIENHKKLDPISSILINFIKDESALFCSVPFGVYPNNFKCLYKKK